MSTPSFNKVAAVIFGLVAFMHVVRISYALPVTIGTMDVPGWVSWVAAIVAAALSVWGFRLKPM